MFDGQMSFIWLLYLNLLDKLYPQAAWWIRHEPPWFCFPPAGHCGFAKVDCKPLQGAGGSAQSVSKCGLLTGWVVVEWDLSINFRGFNHLPYGEIVGIAGLCFQTIQHTLRIIIANPTATNQYMEWQRVWTLLKWLFSHDIWVNIPKWPSFKKH